MLKTKEEPTGVGQDDKNLIDTTEQLMKGNQHTAATPNSRSEYMAQPTFSYPKNGLYGLL